MRPLVDVVLAAVDVTAGVFVMRGAFKHHHPLAQARRHLAYVLRGRRHRPGLDEQIVQAAIGGYTGPVGRGLMMTADLRALYPHDTEDQAVLRAPTRKRSAAPYERARLAAGALTARVHALRRADCLNSRPRPRTVTMPTTPSPRSGLRPGRRAREWKWRAFDMAPRSPRALDLSPLALTAAMRVRGVGVLAETPVPVD
ncbi:hypothetical protein [Streptomyces erythrochromogenes]|uniref:hypothetical protein n=1 Tax=Streptomyces erythrochromogenes TaxID=285574 RepID=UPI003803059C